MVLKDCRRPPAGGCKTVCSENAICSIFFLLRFSVLKRSQCCFFCFLSAIYFAFVIYLSRLVQCLCYITYRQEVPKQRRIQFATFCWRVSQVLNFAIYYAQRCAILDILPCINITIAGCIIWGHQVNEVHCAEEPDLFENPIVTISSVNYLYSPHNTFIPKA